MSFDSQSNTRRGPITRTAAEDLSGKEGYLVLLNGDGKVILPNAITDITPYVLIRGNTNGGEVDIEPLDPGKNVRLRLNGTCNAGDMLCLDAITGGNDGKARAVPANAGTYRVIAIAEEDGVDEQLVLARPHLVGNVVVT